MPRTTPSWAALSLTPLTVSALALGALAPPAHADEDERFELITNGDFSDGTAGWWSTDNITMEIVDGHLCAEVPGGTTNPWDVIIGQDNIPMVDGESYDLSFTASATPAAPVRALVQQPIDPYPTQFDETILVQPELDTHEHAFTANADWDDGQVAFQVGGRANDWTFCLAEVSLLTGAEPPVYEPDTGPRVRVNQVGYLPEGPKRATVVTDATEALPWELADADGETVAAGETVPHGHDPTSDQDVHTIDFTDVTARGTGFTLSADGETSWPFDIDAAAYADLRVDSLSFYYPQRSGIEILDEIAPGYGRDAGHIDIPPNQGDTDVPCLPDTCDYSLDVAGGWYDAGDHGKYVVNGGISVHQLMSTYERTHVAPTADPDALGDGTLRIPEQGNDVPDILDEARWQLEFLLTMQVPEGEELAGMAHHKIHDEFWTGLPLMPADDPQRRFLHPPSTAATLNLAAAGAQCGRLYAPYDADFAAECLEAAETAWEAAVANPDHYASPGGEGGGPYDDVEVRDEFYWAAAELYITTGEQRYADHILSSEMHTDDVFTSHGLSWQWTAPLGRLQLAMIPNDLPDRDRVRESVVEGAEQYLTAVEEHPYGLAYAPDDGVFVWGSNSQVLNNMVVMATAFDLTGELRFRDGVVEGMDYILGRNALNQSYVTDYGTNDVRNQHSRWYANQLDPDLPNPPPGTVSGGPNSIVETWDPVAQANLQGCAPQFCFIDHIGSWATNELTINWNSTLAWVASFVADQGDGTPPTDGSCEVDYRVHGSWPGGFTTQVTVRNTGDSAVDGWDLRWSFLGGTTVRHHWGATLEQHGTVVTARNLPWNRTLAPGRSTTFGFNGSHPGGPNPAPELFLLNGAACA